MGIGPVLADKLISDGLTHVRQLHTKKFMHKLSEETQLFLRLNPNNQIPHEDIRALEPYIDKLQTPDMKLTLVGSYRREKPTSRDIDVMVVSDSNTAIDEFITRLRQTLNDKAYPYSKGKDKASIILNLRDIVGKPAVYKLDAFRVKFTDAIPMLLYSTGSKTFNITMRAQAKKKGMLLNQKGLFKNGIKIPNLNSEHAYFAALDMKYLEPRARI